MPSAIVKPATTAVRWPVPAALALAPLVLGILVSFSSDHSARYGLVVLAIYAGVSAAASIVVAVLTSGAARVAAFVKLAWGAVLGAIAVCLAATVATLDGGGGAFTLQLGVVATLGGFGIADLVVGLVERGRDRFGRDWMTLGVLEILAGIVAILVPSGYRVDYTVTDKSLPPVALTLDAAVMIVGLLGAALAVIGVYLAISAVSLMGGRKKAQQPA